MKYDTTIFWMGPSLIIITFILFGGIIGQMIANDIIMSKECKLKYPNEKFCDYVQDGVECGYNCIDLDLRFYHYERGGIFATDDCVCINQDNEIIKLY